MLNFMRRHFDRVERRAYYLTEAKLKLAEFRLSLDQIGHYSKIEKDALQALDSAYRQKEKILSQYKTLESQVRSGQLDNKSFKRQVQELKRELNSVKSEIKEMERLDRRIHQKLKGPIRDFKDAHNTFRKLLRA
jgi:septal ring factor EnvC (AmiA/AmiB activator)